MLGAITSPIHPDVLESLLSPFFNGEEENVLTHRRALEARMEPDFSVPDVTINLEIKFLP